MKPINIKIIIEVCLGDIKRECSDQAYKNGLNIPRRAFLIKNRVEANVWYVRGETKFQIEKKLK